MRAEIILLRQRLNTTFIYVTHDQTEAMTLGDRIVIMKDGYIMQVGTPEEVFDRPGNLFVAEFIGAPKMNIMKTRLVRGDGEYYVTVEHEMTKSHYISFLSCVGSDAVHIAKTYPEWYCQARFPVSPKAKLYCYCNRHGLFRKDIRAARKHDEFADLPDL